MNYQDDLYDWVMEHNPEMIDSSLWSEEEREALHKARTQFIRDLPDPEPPKIDPKDMEKLRRWVDAVNTA